MAYFLRKSLDLGGLNTTALAAHRLYSMPIPLMLFARRISSNAKEHSFAVTYLISRCGFSPESAVSAAKHVHFETPDKPDSVLALFKSHGFSEIQISLVVRRFPGVLLSNPKKTLSPKLEFLYSKGASNSDVTRIISGSPSFLKFSLEKKIIPSFNFFRNLLQSNEKTINTLKRYADILRLDLETYAVHNMNILKGVGVPDLKIVFLLQVQPRTLMINGDKFRGIVQEVKKMGLNPLKTSFILAVHVMAGLSKSTWERKVEIFRKWGLSEGEVLTAFRMYPLCMTKSEDKIMAVMNIVVNQLGLEPLFVAKHPAVLSLSLGKRIIPRAAVAQVLASKVLLGKRIGLWSLFSTKEELFVEKYVLRYEEEAPELLKLYKDKLDLSG